MTPTATDGGTQTSKRITKRDITTGKEKPAVLSVIVKNIPGELKARRQWVIWRYKWIPDKGKWDKPPLNARTGGAASSTDSQTWSTFEEADEGMKKYGADGIGFVCSDDDDYVALDVDDCRDIVTGELTPDATKIVRFVGGYSEVSPSGTGVRIFVRGRKPEGRCKTGNYEIFEKQKYLTVTGSHLPGTPLTVANRQDEIDWYYREYIDPPAKTPEPSPRQATLSIVDDEIIAKASAAKNGEKFRRLMAGDTSEYGDDDSRADSALCCVLAFWTKDPGQIDRIFRQSGLMRAKWDSPRPGGSYGSKTIGRALEVAKETYTPRATGGFSLNGNASSNASGRTVATAVDDSTPKVNEAADDPHRLARLFIAQSCTHPDGLTQRYWRDESHRWNGSAYRPLPEKELRAELTATIKTEMDRINIAAQELAAANGEDKVPLARKVTGRLVADVMHALASLTILPFSTEPPAWINGEGSFPAHEILAANNGLIHLPSFVSGSDHFLAHTPRLFSPTALGYDFDPDPQPPEHWFGFLEMLWPDDEQSIGTLQEWFGYMLTPDTRQQKILLLVGPKRSGKGTIARVLRGMVGPENVAGPTLASLGMNFGIWPLLGKTAVIVSDARLSGRTDAAVVTERLLSISGEDALTVDRKNLAPVTTKLLARFTILTNELPRLGDASGALAGRMILLRLTNSWYGKEDIALTDRLLAELPGILYWALEGWKRHRDRGYFVQPDAGREMLEDLDDLSSPVGAFIREMCITGPGHCVSVDTIFGTWRAWCDAKGRKDHGTEQTFGRDLVAAVPMIRKTRPGTGTGRYRAYEGIGVR